MTGTKNKQKDEGIQVTESFNYKLRECSLNFNLIGVRQMKDFKVLLVKGLEDLEKKISEYENK